MTLWLCRRLNRNPWSVRDVGNVMERNKSRTVRLTESEEDNKLDGGELRERLLASEVVSRQNIEYNESIQCNRE